MKKADINIVTKGIATSNKKLLVAPGITTRNKKLLVTRALLGLGFWPPWPPKGNRLLGQWHAFDLIKL